jgi:hypothetical protein
MKLNDIINDKTKLTIVVVSVLIILFPIGYSIVAFAVSPDADTSGPFIEKPDEKKYKECIEDARFMRRQIHAFQEYGSSEGSQGPGDARGEKGGDSDRWEERGSWNPKVQRMSYRQKTVL